MIIYPSQIIKAAENAGMKVPILDKKDESFLAEEFPHFHVFCNVQLGCAVTWGNHWENAKIIARIPEKELITLTIEGLKARGFDP